MKALKSLGTILFQFGMGDIDITWCSPQTLWEWDEIQVNWTLEAKEVLETLFDYLLYLWWWFTHISRSLLYLYLLLLSLLTHKFGKTPPWDTFLLHCVVSLGLSRSESAQPALVEYWLGVSCCSTRWAAGFTVYWVHRESPDFILKTKCHAKWSQILTSKCLWPCYGWILLNFKGSKLTCFYTR